MRVSELVGTWLAARGVVGNEAERRLAVLVELFRSICEGLYLGLLDYAARYDEADSIRSLASHTQWLAALPCPVLRLDGEAPVETHVRKTLERLHRNAGAHGPWHRRE